MSVKSSTESDNNHIATESLHADHTRGELHQLAGLHSARWISLCALVFFDSVATCFYSVYDWHWRCCAFGVTSCGFIDSTLALLLKIHLRFRGSFLRFHIMALVNMSKRLTQVGIVHKRNTNLQVLLLFFLLSQHYSLKLLVTRVPFRTTYRPKWEREKTANSLPKLI